MIKYIFNLGKINLCVGCYTQAVHPVAIVGVSVPTSLSNNGV